MNKPISIFQIYFDELTKKHLDPAFIPCLNDRKDGYFENSVIKELHERFKDDTTAPQYIGTTSWKQKLKIRLVGEEIISHIEEDIRTGSQKDVYLFSPISNVEIVNRGEAPPQFKYNGVIKEQDIWTNHKNGFGTAYDADVLLNKSGVLPFNLFDGKWAYSHCNYWVASKKVFDHYCEEVLLPALAWFEREDIKQLTGKNNYLHKHEQKNYPIYSFVMEGLFGAFLAHHDYSYSYLYKKKTGRKIMSKINIVGYDSLKGESAIQSSNARAQVEKSDLLIIHSCDNLLYFHCVELLQDVMERAGKRVSIFNISKDKGLPSYIKMADNIICYRTEVIPDGINADNKKVGYLIDDNIFYEGNDAFITSSLRDRVRQCVKKADYCLSFSEELTKELSKVNTNSFCIGNPPLWKERYDKHKVIEPTIVKDSTLTIGIIARNHFDKSIFDVIKEAHRNISNPLRVIYFHYKPTPLSEPNILFEHRAYTAINMQGWYNALHGLKLDMVLAQYDNHVLVASKSDLKFRESAYMKVPLIAIDPSGKIYSDIINGENGYTVSNKQEAIAVLSDLFKHPEKLKEMGINAYDTLKKRSPDDFANRFEGTIKKALKQTLAPIQVFKPLIRNEAIESVVETLKSGWLGTGPKTKLFEEEFKKYINTSGQCVATISATDALEIAIKMLDLKEGDEIITTPITFISTNHAILYNGATPVFADVDKSNGNILPESIIDKITPRTKAIMAVHLSGNSCDMSSIERIAENYNLKIIEDCAHATGGTYRNGKHEGKKIGASNNMCCFSFQTVKNLPAGDGGMLVVPTKEIADRANHLRWMGIDKDTYSRTSAIGEYLWKYDVPEVGIKANQNDIMSSIGLAQLKYIDADNERRRFIARHYKEKLSSHAKISLPDIDINLSACHFYPIYVEGRDALLMHLRENNIFCGVHYRRNDKYANYQEQNLPNAEFIEFNTLTLPIHLHLTNHDLDRITDAILQWQ